MYTDRNFKTKKALKAAVEAWNAYNDTLANPNADAIARQPKPRVTYHQPGPWGGNEPRNGKFCVEGPHYPEPHRWYASCEARDGVIVKVK